MKNYTDITVLLDKSGSMSGQAKSTIDGFNEFLRSQQSIEGKADFTFIQFANPESFNKIYTATPIKSVAQLGPDTYVADGYSTAYLDALGRLIKETGERLNAMPTKARPDKVIFVVMTDGQENSSREFTKSRIKEMIQHQEDKYNWKFVFLGANMDAVKEGSSLGVNPLRSYTYTADPKGIANVYLATSNVVSSYRSSVTSDLLFTEEDRKK